MLRKEILCALGILLLPLFVNSAEILSIPLQKVSGNVIEKTADPVWDKSLVLHSFVRLGLTEENAPYKTQIRLFHDREKLYFIAYAETEGRAVANGLKRDDLVWDDDSISFFIVPDPSKPSFYFHIAVNAKGTVFDERYEKRGEGISAWNASSLQIRSELRNNGYLISGSVLLREVGIVNSGQIFSMNAARRINCPGKRDYSTWSILKKSSFHDTEAFPHIRLADGLVTPPAAVSFSQMPELCIDGEFEIGSNRRWTGRKEVWTCDYYACNGKKSMGFIVRKSGEVSHAVHRLSLTPGEQYSAEWAVRYHPLESANHKPVSIHFYNASGKRISSVTGPGLGNLGGGAGNNRFDRYDMVFTAPRMTSYGEVEIKLDDLGTFFADCVRIMKYKEKNLIPAPLSPATDSVLRSPSISLKWKLFETPANMIPGSCTVELSRDSKFPVSKTITYQDVDNTSWDITVPEQGTWFWRVRFNGKHGGKWSEVHSFSVQYTHENEKIAPRIGELFPRGKIAQRPDRLTWKFSDGPISSGIDLKSLSLKINGLAVIPDAVGSDGISFRLPADGKKFYDLELTVLDKNKNRAYDCDFIYFSTAPEIVKIDSEGFITRDAQRVFPNSRYAQRFIDTFPMMQEKGYNANLTPWIRVAEATLRKTVNEAYRNGIDTFVYVFAGLSVERGYIPMDSFFGREMKEYNRRALERIKGHPGVIGFYIGDESLDQGGVMSVYAEHARYVKLIVPDRIVTWLPTWSHANPNLWRDAAKFTDLLFFDDYVINRRQHLSLFKTLDMLATTQKHCPMSIIGAHSIPSEWNTKKRTLPKIEDLRFCIYASIIGRSRGIVFYTDPDMDQFAKRNPYAGTNRPEYLDILFTLSSELRELTPYLIRNDQDTKTVLQVKSGQARSVLKSLGKKQLLIAVNSGDAPCRLKVNFPASGTVRERISGKTFQLNSGRPSFEMELPGLGVGLFEFTAD